MKRVIKALSIREVRERLGGAKKAGAKGPFSNNKGKKKGGGENEIGAQDVAREKKTAGETEKKMKNPSSPMDLQEKKIFGQHQARGQGKAQGDCGDSHLRGRPSPEEKKALILDAGVIGETSGEKEKK